MKDIENNDLKQYETEVKEKWGHTNAYQEYNKKTKEYSKEKWENINNKMNNIFLNFSICMQNNESIYILMSVSVTAKYKLPLWELCSQSY